MDAAKVQLLHYCISCYFLARTRHGYDADYDDLYKRYAEPVSTRVVLLGITENTVISRGVRFAAVPGPVVLLVSEAGISVVMVWLPQPLRRSPCHADYFSTRYFHMTLVSSTIQISTITFCLRTNQPPCSLKLPSIHAAVDIPPVCTYRPGMG